MPIVKVNDINLYYETRGEGEPLVMIMGFGGDQTAWNKQVPAFSKRYKVIMFDNRGVGKSDKPNGPYSAKLMAEDTVRLLDHLKIEKAHILGVSMGGLIAQELAISYPERVNKLILASTWCRQDNEGNGLTPTMLEATGMAPVQKMNRLLNAAFNKFLYRYILVQFMKLQIRKMKEPEKTGIEGQTACVLAFDSFDRLPAIPTQTLVITGAKDRVIKPESSDCVSRQIANSKLVKIQNGSHMVFWEKFKPFNGEVLEFLQKA